MHIEAESLSVFAGRSGSVAPLLIGAAYLTPWGDRGHCAGELTRRRTAVDPPILERNMIARAHKIHKVCRANSNAMPKSPAVLLLLTLAVPAKAQPQAGAPWPMFGYNS